MAAAERSRYGQNAVYGSLAYDFNRTGAAEEWEEEYSAPRTPAAKPQTRTRTQTRTRAKAVARSRQSIEPASIMGMLVAAFLLVTGIVARVQLLNISATSVELEEQLGTLQEEQTKLRIFYESAFNLSEIEEYATSSLGMQKPSTDQINYIDTSSPDRAAVVEAQTRSGFVDTVADFLTGFWEYFQSGAK
ncbi:MAG: hypothetical protein LUE95_05790 [Oscillospiraceae bacterium]|nr:hypothetical protein [Oscillospiraceae bacterium]